MPNLTLANPLFVIIGPSGSGKTRVTEMVFPQDAKIITHTTRPKRLGEVEGIDYYFETETSFNTLFTTGKLVEQDNYHGHHYGVSLAEIIKRTSKKPAYTILTLSGFKKVQAYFPDDTIVIFFQVNQEHVQTRLAQRENNPQTIAQRLALYKIESQAEQVLRHYPRYYPLDANQAFEDVVADLEKIVNKER